MELSSRVDLPHDLTVRGSNAMEHPLGAKNIDAIVIDDRAAARAIIVAVVILVVRRIFKLPEEFTIGAIKRAQARLVVMPVELKESAAADGRHAIARSDGLLPKHLKPAGRA